MSSDRRNALAMQMLAAGFVEPMKVCTASDPNRAPRRLSEAELARLAALIAGAGVKRLREGQESKSSPEALVEIRRKREAKLARRAERAKKGGRRE